MFKNLQRTLYFHSPLLLCLFLGSVVYFIERDYLKNVVIPLVVLYFVVRYFWRKHLKKIGKYGMYKVSIWAVFFTIILTVFVIYLTLIPEEQKFVTYHPEHPTPERFAVNAKLSDYMKTFLDQMLVCGYLMQEKKLTQCEVMSSVELDNNPETFEVLILDQKVRACERNSCNLVIGQMTKDAMEKARAHQEENAPPSEGKMINSWQVTNPIVQMNPELHGGWNTFEFSLNDILYVWEYDLQSERYVNR